MRDPRGPDCNHWRRLVLVTCAVLVSVAVARAQPGGQELEGKPVLRIELKGLRALEPAAVKTLMETKEGAPFDPEKLDMDIKKLMSENVFQFIPWVEAELNNDGTGVLVTLEASDVGEQALRVVFLGILEFDRKDLLPLIQTAGGKRVNDFTLKLDQEELLKFYKKGGYHYAQVDFIKKREPTGNLIIFKITEGPKVTIRNVEIRGAKSFPDDELMGQMLFVDTPGLFSSKEFVLEQIHRDMVALQKWYWLQGFRDVRVYLADWTPTPDHEEVDLVIDVREGPPFLVRSVTIEGVTLFDPKDFIALMRTKVGNRLNLIDDFASDRRDIEGAYHELGYTEASVKDASTIDLELPEIDVIIRVQEGELVRVGEIIIRGNLETKDNVIRREIELYTGEPLNLKKKRRSERRIMNLRYWNDQGGVHVGTPSISYQAHQIFKDAYISLADTERKHVKDIVVNVEEKDTGSLRFAAGIGSNSGFVGDITYRKDNFDPLDMPDGFDDILSAFTGAGQFLVLSFQPGTIATRWRIAWGIPRIFDSPYGVVGDVFKSTFIREDWDEERVGGSLRVTRRLGDDLSAGITLRDEVVDTYHIDSDAPQLVFDFQGENRVVKTTLDLRLSRLDDFLDPTDGYSVDLIYERGGWWGDIEYDKVVLSGEHYQQLYEDSAERVHVLQLRGSVGWEAERGGTRDVPVYERFFLGGSGSLRGFDFRGVGPRDNGDPIGGKAVWTAGIQYAYPLVGEQLRGVAFVDTGAIGLDWDDSDIWAPRVSVGVGVRLVIPFLGQRPIAIDFGIPIVKEPQDDTLLISFNFGSNF